MTPTLHHFAAHLDELVRNYKAKGMPETVRDLNRARQLVQLAVSHLTKPAPHGGVDVS